MWAMRRRNPIAVQRAVVAPKVFIALIVHPAMALR
jgi:hypothetical protein